MVEMQSELVCRYLPDTTLTFVNDAYCRYFGKKRGELVGKSFLTLLPAEANEAIRDHVRALCENRKPMSSEHEVIGPDGQIGWQRWEDRVILNEDGSIHELQAVGRDITKEKQAEESLRRKQQELSRLLEHYERLTPREREVMTLVVEGQLNKEIAAKTGITERTIKFHRRQIMERMQARSLAELVRMAEKLEGLNGRY
jgi:PAS domain S-box-containing protein